MNIESTIKDLEEINELYEKKISTLEDSYKTYNQMAANAANDIEECKKKIEANNKVIERLREDDDVKEADIYVRDHLLIEWLVDHLLLPSTNIEALHDAWTDYINKEEAKHG